MLVLLLMSVGFVKAQKSIPISDSLSANAEKLNVKLGSEGIGKIWKMRFGEYAVVSSRRGWTAGSSRFNLFDTKSESKSTEKFSFVLSGKSNDSARVNAAMNIHIRELHAIKVIPGFYLGDNGLLEETHNFTSYITINGDTTETWALFLNTSTGQEMPDKYEAYLTNGERKIYIFSRFSETKGNKAFAMPAAGYEFIEDGQSLSALQYAAGGLFPTNKNIIWLNNALNPKMKLVLAAVMTAILELKLTEQQSRVGE